jgi:hypothetical protein
VRDTRAIEKRAYGINELEENNERKAKWKAEAKSSREGNTERAEN